MAEASNARDVAREAYIYAYPMIQHYGTLYKQVGDPNAREFTGGFGSIRNYAEPSSPANHDVVTPNNDTPYSWLWLDLRAEPWVLSVPEVASDRYYVVQLIDLFTFNFAYIGVRSTGREAGSFLISGPDWEGSTPSGIRQVFSSETSIVLALIRTELKGSDDVDNVKAIQAQYKAQPLSSFQGTEAARQPAPISFVPYNEAKAQSPDFIQYLNLLLQFCQPPHKSEVALWRSFESIGAGPGLPWSASSNNPTLLAAIGQGVAEAQALLNIALSKTLESNGLFGSREYMRNDYMKRAVAAAKGLYGNSIEEAWYGGFVGDGNTLGALEFGPGELPPAKFFWSFTLYTLPDRFLYANEAERYSLGDRTPNLKFSEDGSLTLYIGHVAPGGDRESNWLPAPAGKYSLVARIYGPQGLALEGSWKLPPLQTADHSEGLKKGDHLASDEVKEIAHSCYIYAYPLILMELTRRVGTNVATTSRLPKAPMNQFAHLAAFPDAKFTDVVRPNADTLYSVMFYDVSKEPLIAKVPDSAGRYYLMPILDMWTDIFAAPGTRTTGTGAIAYALVGPGWQGQLPADVIRYDSPTAIGWVIGRTQTNGKADYDAVHKFQAGVKSIPLSKRGTEYSPSPAPVNPDYDMKTSPVLQLEKLSPAEYFSLFTDLVRHNPPHIQDYPIRDQLRRIGIELGKPLDFAALPADVRSALTSASLSALRDIKAKSLSSNTIVNGWAINYNTVGSYGTDYLARAAIAYAALGANLPQDTIYPTATTDSDGNPLTSAGRYKLHFAKDQLPPVRGFWSLTVYNERQGFAENAIDRYAIGDRDELVFGGDGGLDVLVQREEPGEGERVNWLPAPKEGVFTMNLRLYWPEGEVLEGRWVPPAVVKVG